MKLFKKFISIFLFLFLLIPLYFTYANTYVDPEVFGFNDSTQLTAVLYDTTEYASGTGNVLTESGIEINNWEYNASKYLQIDPLVPDDGNTYKVIVELPQEFYFVLDELALPSGYKSVDFIKNSDLSVNGTSKYSLKKYSGTIEYTMSKLQTSGTIQLEIRYDSILWDKFANSSLTADGVIPIKVRLEKVEQNSETTVMKTLIVNRVMSGSKMDISKSSTLSVSTGSYYGDSYISKINETISQSFSLSSQSTAASYFKKLVLDITLPYYTDASGNVYYLEAMESTLTLPSFVSSNTTIVQENGKLTITIPDLYFSSNSINILKFNYINAENLLENVPGDKFAFSKATAKIFVDGKNGVTDQLFGSINTASITYNKNLVENVVMTSSGKSVSILNRPDNAVSQLGGFYLENLGTGDSSRKTIYHEFDITNSSLVKVTTIRILSDTLQEYINIEYTLVDESGEKVYLDNNGQRVSFEDDSASSVFNYSLKNTYYKSSSSSNISNKLTRQMLPEAHRKYYFKTIKFELFTIKSGAKLYAQSATASITGAGNFYGYIDESATVDSNIRHKTTVTSSDTNIAVLSKEIKTTLNLSNKTAYMINSASMSKESITAGESLILKTAVKAITYPYGNSTWLRDIVVGLVLPEGVSVNEQGIEAKFYNNTKITDFSVETPINIENGNVLWKIKLASDICIGLADENLGGLTNSNINNEVINFSIQLDTSAMMNASTLFATDMIFVAGYNQTNSAGGSYSYAGKVDTYDLNDNGSVTDKVGGLSSTNTVSCQISPLSSSLDAFSSIYVTHKGNITSEDVEQKINSFDDVITYNLDIGCSSGGYIDNFQYYIPIPKNVNLEDGFLISNSSDQRFGLTLQNAAVVSGSNIFNVQYTFEENLNYNDAKNIKNWYNASQVVNWNDVTMIKLTVIGGVIYNGDNSRISINLKYEGNNYGEQAGFETIWSSGGYYNYISNGRILSGNFNTNTVAVKLNYELNLDDIILTAAYGMNPQIEGNINEKNVYDNIPKFIKEQSFSIKEIETYNVNLQTKDYILNNLEMTGVEANQTFAISVSLNDGDLYDVTLDNLVNIGLNPSNSVPILKFKLYNANSLNENIQSRYIVVKLESNNGVRLIQKIIINREIAKVTEVAPSIIAGSNYTILNEIASNVSIGKRSSFTAQFTADYIPSLYSEQKIVFSSSLPIGTTITFVDIKENHNQTYWYYIVSEANVSSISLNEFKQMGKITNSNYTFIEGSNLINEQFLFVVDFMNCSSYLNNGAYTVELIFDGTTVDDFNSTNLNFSIKDQRTFNLSSKSSNVNILNSFDVFYNLSEVEAVETNHSGKKLSLVIKMDDDSDNLFPLDSYIEVNNNKYHLNNENEFIIPLGDVQSGSGEVTLKLISNILSAEQVDYDINIGLWVSATANANLPKYGELVSELNMIITDIKKVSPSLKILSLEDRVRELSNIHDTFNLTYSYIVDGDCNATIEIYKKDGSGYQKLTNALTQVNGNTNHYMGTFDIEPISGTNELKFNLSSIVDSGTYRIVLKVFNEDELLLEVPSNFILID